VGKGREGKERGGDGREGKRGRMEGKRGRRVMEKRRGGKYGKGKEGWEGNNLTIIGIYR